MHCNMALNTELKKCHCNRENRNFQRLFMNIPIDVWSDDDATLFPEHN